MNADERSEVAERYWAERGGKPKPRPRHALTDEEENAYLVKGSRLVNRHEFYDGHDEWEEVWRRARGTRRRLLHGLIQVAVGYEHCKRGNQRGMDSLLRQGAAKLEEFTGRPGVAQLRSRALADAKRARTERDLTLGKVRPPKLMLTVEGLTASGPEDAVRIEIPKKKGGRDERW